MNDQQRPSRPARIGRYTILDRIGRGAMGVVYSARDDVMGRDVAIKVMMADLEGEPEISGRFLREAQVAASLAHRNIVTIFDVGEDNGRLFIVMELLRGQTLAECLRDRHLPLEDKIDLMLEVCEGLAVANAAGVCHRDVKPGNLFLLEGGGVKILDFGIARLASSSMTASGFIVGTPDFMSPEQARGSTVDERSDIFSAGAVLYLLLAGRKPFMAPDLPAVLHKVVTEEATPLSNEQAPAHLSRIVEKALAKQPEARYQSFRELSRDLSLWRRRYQTETSASAGEVARRLDALVAIAVEEQRCADVLAIPRELDLEATLLRVSAGHPLLLKSGADGLRGGIWQRYAVDEIGSRLMTTQDAWQSRVSRLSEASKALTEATARLELGDFRSTLDMLGRVQQLVPSSASAETLQTRAQHLMASHQAREQKLRVLLDDAARARIDGTLEAALALIEAALQIEPENREASNLLRALHRDRAAAEANKRARCERLVSQSRRALQRSELSEAEHQLELAREVGIAHPDLVVVGAALLDARAARDANNVATKDIAAELALARAEFQDHRRVAALKRLDDLAIRHPVNTRLSAELARMRADDEHFTQAEQARLRADGLAEEAALALSAGDAGEAAKLARQASTLRPEHEAALRIYALAQAQLREAAERQARADNARRALDAAKTHLAQADFQAAIREARHAVELDPAEIEAQILILRILRGQAEAAAPDDPILDTARLATRAPVTLDQTTLEAKEHGRAQTLAEQALALDPDASAQRDLLARVALAAPAANHLDEDTVAISCPDPDDTAALPAQGGSWWSTLVERLQRLWSDRGVADRGAVTRPPARPAASADAASASSGEDYRRHS